MCYAEPMLGAAITAAVWQKTKSVKTFWLMLLFVGGSLFGLIDHAWNGELFQMPKALGSDLLLGAVISAGIMFFWGLIVWSVAKNPLFARQIGFIAE